MERINLERWNANNQYDFLWVGKQIGYKETAIYERNQENHSVYQWIEEKHTSKQVTRDDRGQFFLFG